MSASKVSEKKIESSASSNAVVENSGRNNISFPKNNKSGVTSAAQTSVILIHNFDF
jgi:hypothetical protein